MFNGNPKLPALASFALLGLLAAGPAPAPRLRYSGCGELHRLYSPRLLRELRLRLLAEYAEAHERRARVVVRLLRTGHPFDPMIQMERFAIAPQESDDPRMKHLLAYVAMNCL